MVFGRGIQSSVNQQIVIYVFARVMLAWGKILVKKRNEGGLGVGWAMRERIENNAWPVFASLSWAMVMWMFRWYPETIQPSLRSSMKYMYAFFSAKDCPQVYQLMSCSYVDSDHWTNFNTFLLRNR